MEQDWTENCYQVMAPWRVLNFKGKMMLVSCILNSIAAVIIANEGSYFAVVSWFFAMWCGLTTLHPRYQYKDAKNINDERQE
jgi:hypothetical protein